MKRTVYGYIDGLKGLAIIAVLLVHTISNELPGFIGNIVRDGARGVQLFFVISGFLAFKSMEKCFVKSGVTARLAFNWLLNRFIRLVPLYYLALLVCMLTRTNSTYWLGENNVVTFNNILAHLLLLHGLFPRYANSILGVEWYLGCLWIFYLISPFMYKYIDNIRKAFVLLISTVLLLPWLKRLLSYTFITQSNSYIYDAYITVFNPFAQLLTYIFGIVLFYFVKALNSKQETESTNTLNKSYIYIYIYMIGIVLLLVQTQIGITMPIFSRQEMFGLIFCIIILSQSIHSSKTIDNPLFRSYGKYSYGIYLFQFIWLHFFDKIFTYSGSYYWIMRFLISSIFLLGISFLLSNCFEKPIIDLVKRLTNNAKQ